MNEQDQIYYKVLLPVVTDKGIKLLSCYSQECSLEYDIGLRTVPKIKNSKLFVFAKIINARKFAGAGDPLSNFLVYKCLVENPRLAPDWIAYPGGHTLLRFTEFWSGICKITGYPPPETYLVDSVTLLEKEG